MIFFFFSFFFLDGVVAVVLLLLVLQLDHTDFVVDDVNGVAVEDDAAIRHGGCGEVSSVAFSLQGKQGGITGPCTEMKLGMSSSS